MEPHEEIKKLKRQLEDAHLIMVTALHLKDVPKATGMLGRYFHQYNIGEKK